MNWLESEFHGVPDANERVQQNDFKFVNGSSTIGIIGKCIEIMN